MTAALVMTSNLVLSIVPSRAGIHPQGTGTPIVNAAQYGLPTAVSSAATPHDTHDRPASGSAAMTHSDARF